MRDALRSYLSAASGRTEVPRRRAAELAKALLAHGEETAEQVGVLTEELLETGRNNREALASLIRYEVDRTLARMGLASGDEVLALAVRVAALEGLAFGPPGARAARARAAAAPARRAPAKKSPAKKSAAAKSAAAKATPKQPPVRRPAAKANRTGGRAASTGAGR